MKVLVKCLLALVIISSIGSGKDLEEYIKEAEAYQESGKIQQAISTMEDAVKEHPNSSMAYTKLGIFISMQVQGIKDFTEMFKAIERAFRMWDKAISFDPNNFTARFYRGGWGVNIPKFIGQLEKGINDLEFLIQVFGQSPDPTAKEQLVSAYNLLGTGYQKQGEYQKAKQSYKKLIDIVPGTKYADEAKENINRIVIFEKWQSQRNKRKKPYAPIIMELEEKVQKESNNTHLLIELGEAYFDAENYEEAERVLEKAVSLDSSNIKAHRLLALTLGEIAMEGYNQRIYMDTDFRTNLAFESMKFLDKAVNLTPEDIDLRFLRGVMGVSFPFFVGKLGQGIEDLNMVLDSDAPDSIKANALYYLGMAYQKKATTHWIQVVTEYSNSEASRMVFDEMIPAVKHVDFSKYRYPILIIDFVLGFRDELAPQTAVWIEDKNGKFVKTVYVSGFSGYAKEKQVNLPMWTNSSEFVDVDGVTGASINLGHYIYVWDLKGVSFRKVKSGEYIIKVEVAYWPSMKYQLVSATIKLGKKEARIVVKEWNLIPYLDVKYFPKGGK